VGWKLEDYAMGLGIFDRLAIWERGMPFRQLWSLYAAADAFLLTSKAEGLAMPVLEAMACRLPVVGTKCAAIEEHLQDGRGLLIEPDYVMIDPFGNSRRYFASREDGARKLANLADQPGIKKAMTNQALGYVQARKWENAGQVLAEAIERAKAAKVPAVLPQKVAA
jgi:glycosyltransferase involved in cell wall biosynthesis